MYTDVVKRVDCPVEISMTFANLSAFIVGQSNGRLPFLQIRHLFRYASLIRILLENYLK